LDENSRTLSKDANNEWKICQALENILKTRKENSKDSKQVVKSSEISSIIKFG
jgi:hypothetical protein